MREHLNPSETWQQEDENFSSWLARNLDLLDKILRTKLDLERPVGPFFADILCLNRIDNSHVIIANQLERTDHKHLGQILTYATELQARTIIWIATEFENEHRNTLDWLNDNMNDNFRFFGIELTLKPTDDSGCIPKFTVIAKPQNKYHQRTDDYSETTSEYSSEPPYWSAFREYWAENSSVLKPWEWDEDRHSDYFGFYIESFEDIWFAAWRGANHTQIAAKLCLKGTDAELYFDRLKEQQHSIEAEFEQRLEWDRSPGYSPFPQIGLYNRRITRDKADWPNQFEWLQKTLEKLDNVFRTRISECTQSDYRSPTTAAPENTSYQQRGSDSQGNYDDNLAKKYWFEFQKYCNDKGISLKPLPPELGAVVEKMCGSRRDRPC